MRFGLITEGITDQLVIKTIIAGVFHDEENEIIITELCPMDNEPSGWTKVLEKISSDDFRRFLDTEEDYCIIHIDSDTKDHWKGILKTDKYKPLLSAIPTLSGGHEDQVEALITSIVALLREVIGSEFYDEHSQNIIFAIAVHDIECWLLPLHTTTKSHYKKIVSCLGTLNPYIKRKYGFTIDPAKKGSDNYSYYWKVIKDLRDNKVLMKIYNLNPSLELFVNQLLEIKK